MNSMKMILPAATYSMSRVTVFVCCGNLFAIVFLQRIVIPLGGRLQVSCLLPIALLSLLYLGWTQRASIDLTKLFWLSVFLLAAIIAHMFGNNSFSMPSLALLIVLYCLWVVEIPIGRSEFLDVLAFFQNCMAWVAGLVGLQYATQLVGLPTPILEHIVPNKFIVRDFNYLQEVFWGSGIMKANGIVMLEASFLSQFLALALIVETAFFGRRNFTILFVTGLIASFSGTGMMLAMLAMPFLLIKRSASQALFLCMALVAGLILLASMGWLNAITDRLGEFSDRDASASLRFEAPFMRIIGTLREGDLATILWGAGAGFIDQERTGFAWNAPCKIWIEYGAFTFFPYALFLLVVFFKNAMSRAMSSVMLLEYLIFGGGALLQPPIVFSCFFLAAGYRRADSLYPGRISHAGRDAGIVAAGADIESGHPVSVFDTPTRQNARTRKVSMAGESSVRKDVLNER